MFRTVRCCRSNSMSSRSPSVNMGQGYPDSPVWDRAGAPLSATKERGLIWIADPP